MTNPTPATDSTPVAVQDFYRFLNSTHDLATGIAVLQHTIVTRWPDDHPIPAAWDAAVEDIRDAITRLDEAITTAAQP